MSKKKDDKKNTKKQEQQERERALQQQRQEEEKRQKQMRQRQEYLENKSSPLINYGLIDAFEFFMVQLTQAGIPQGNVYEFAAQAVLKFEKNLRKKTKNIDQVNRFNESVVRSSPTKQSSQAPGSIKTSKAPQLTPFKKQLTQQQKAILNNLNSKQQN